MRFLVCFFLFSITFFGSSAQVWTSAELSSAHTAASVNQLTQEEKLIIQYVNLARMYPQKFALLEVKNYMGEAKYSNYLEDSPYKRSLMVHLRKMKPLPPVIFDASMYALATCFAEESGQRGYVGHNRRDCPEGYYGECCSYGHKKGKDIALSLLIDHDVPSLGHREICLSDRYDKIGVRIAYHKKYGHCAVLDFK
jgi:uncharacterized protein YkwD